MNSQADDGFNRGLFQVAVAFHSGKMEPGESLFDPEVNIRVAYSIWSNAGGTFRKDWPSCGRD